MDFIRAAVANGRHPALAPSGATVLKDGRRYKNLVSSAGEVTAAGRLYETEMGVALDTNGYATGQVPTRSGDVERISMRRGEDRVVR